MRSKIVILTVVFLALAQPALAQPANARVQALKEKIRQIVVDESIVKMRASVTSTMKGHVDLVTSFENLKPDIQTEARREGFGEGHLLAVRINTESLV